VAGTRDAAVDIRLLGPVEVFARGRGVKVGGPRQQALLALLLLEPGRAVSADRLIDELWHGEPPAGAARTLRSYVSRLRRALGRDVVEARASGYGLVVEPDSVDATRFEQLATEGREALARGAAGLAAARLRSALELWRGPALANVAEGGALAQEARRLDELRLLCLEERIEADLALGRHAELIPELERLVREEPLRERPWRQLVLAYYRAERQADALAAYRRARGVLVEELGLEPGEELRKLEQAVLRQQVAPAAPAETRHNLPAPTSSFVGREPELAELERLLRDHRLVTVTGLGGTGKTRLALETALRQAGVWADGIWLVDLTATADGELVLGAVAETLGAAEHDLDALLAHARRLELLLLLDNCEHLVEACAKLADPMLRACPSLRILATSRVPLGLPGEVDFALDPLASPEQRAAGEELERSPAVRLFLERASSVRRDLPHDGRSLVTAGEICRELDGLPLAIELAAARAKTLSLVEIADRLDDRFRFLRAWQRVADPRHQTLQTTLDWSHQLLAPAEQELLRRLSVFAGGATLEAVADVCLDGDEHRAVDLLGRLVDASLVRAEPDGRTRYRLLETVRQYAAAKLADDPHAEAVHRRHAEHYLGVADSANLSIDTLGRGPQRQDLALREQHNLRAALDWAAEQDVELGLRLMLALENFWVGQQAPAEGKRRYERLLARADDLDLSLRASATRDYGAFHDILGEFDRARELYARSGELARQAGDDVGVANATFRLGVVAYYQEGAERARTLWEESREAYRRLGYRIGEVQALGNLGSLEIEHGDAERGREMVEAAIGIAREVGWWWWAGLGHADLAGDALRDGRADEAERHGRQLLEFARRAEDRQQTLLALALLARAAAIRRDDERALALWASVEAVEDAPGRFGKFDRAEYASCMPPRPRPAPLPLEEAVALALSGD
jgi:predicted ATPase/DNA-binding SARP family transcriptional activator